MEYLIFLETEGSTVPHMEPVFATSLDEARGQAQRMLGERATGVQALIYSGDNLLATIAREDVAA